MADVAHSFADDAVIAAHAVMVELLELLQPFRDAVVVVGGWVPELLLATPQAPHDGSTDVDVALDPSRLGTAANVTLRELLACNGFQPGSRPFTFRRTVSVSGRDVSVDVDFLTAASDTQAQPGATRAVQDISALAAPGCELAFRLNETKEVRGARPDGTLAAAEVRVAGIVPFLVMKGLTMGGPRRRYRRKDAYDVFYCVDTYPGGAAGLAEAFRPHLGDPLVRAGLAAIRRQFNSPYGTGPIYVADRRGVEDRAARDLLERDAFQKVDSFLRRLGVE